RRGRGDEFIPPASVAASDEEVAGIAPGDVVIHFNFRPDRARQLCHALMDQNFSGFQRQRPLPGLHLYTMTRFDDRLQAVVVFPKQLVRNTLGEVVSQAGLRQLHLAETEKYAHVTYFLNGGREEPFPGEERHLVPSPRVATYDRRPRMSADGITTEALRGIRSRAFSLIVVNYANADMVGHTGNLAATVAAVEHLDGCLGRLERACAASSCIFLMTADHGNAEAKVDLRDGSPLTAHTNSRVPLVLCHDPTRARLRQGGGLRDVAPTLLRAMALPVPREMTGSDLRTRR
ncbi:MAG: 2,3-bisphosphoglycerate-independent phosphoglycerate mutase, partial [Candidatus Dormibacteria bacterium]